MLLLDPAGKLYKWCRPLFSNGIGDDYPPEYLNAPMAFFLYKSATFVLHQLHLLTCVGPWPMPPR